MSEPKITIEGTELSEAEAMTVRVALGNFQMDLIDGLGPDETGRSICAGYMRCMSNIFKLIMRRNDNVKETPTTEI